jgi:hypothetical protein
LDGETRRTAMEVFGEGGMVEFGQVSRFLVLRGVAVDTLSVDVKCVLLITLRRCNGVRGKILPNLLIKLGVGHGGPPNILGFLLGWKAEG